MLLRCVFCNRPLDKAGIFIGGYPVGSTCAKNRGLTRLSSSITVSIAVRNDQPDLFGDNNDTAKNIK